MCFACVFYFPYEKGYFCPKYIEALSNANLERIYFHFVER